MYIYKIYHKYKHKEKERGDFKCFVNYLNRVGVCAVKEKVE